MAQEVEVINLSEGWVKQDKPITITEGKQVRLSSALVKLMLGGKWPKFHGFGFNEVHSWAIEKDGTLVPMASGFSDEDLAPGPSFKLYMIDDVFSDPPVGPIAVSPRRK